MGENALLGLKNGLEWLQKSVCLLENCFLEPLFLVAKSGSRPINTCASRYYFDSKTTQLHCRAKVVSRTN
jgi:hypothetical protein